MLFLTFLCLNFCSFLCIFYQWLLLKIYPISVWHGRWREGMYGVLPDCVANMYKKKLEAEKTFSVESLLKDRELAQACYMAHFFALVGEG